jgi:hypothetical protein
LKAFPDLVARPSDLGLEIVGALIRKFPFALSAFVGRVVAICETADLERGIALLTDITLYQQNEFFPELLGLFYKHPNQSIPHFLRVCRAFWRFDFIPCFDEMLADDTEFLEALAHVANEDESFAAGLQPFPLRDGHSAVAALSLVVAVLDAIPVNAQEPWIEAGARDFHLFGNMKYCLRR